MEFTVLAGGESRMYPEQLNQALALAVEALAIMVEVEGMKVLNRERLADDKTEAYGESAFQEKAQMLWGMAEALRRYQ